MKTSPFIIPSLFFGLAFAPCPLFAVPDKPAVDFEKAMASGDAEAQFQLARAYLRGAGVEINPGKAFDLMKKAAAQGHANALGAMGYFYATGTAVPKDQDAAVAWFRQGAEKGSAKAQLNLGLAMAKGNGTPKDEKEGLRWIDAAAAQGLADAIYAAGETYYWGQFGRAVDYPKAFPLFEKAAQQGHAGAQNNLGVMIQQGLTGRQDEQGAIVWFRKAAEQGHAKGQSNLGHALGADSVDPAKRRQGLKWILLASDQREITAVKTLEELQPNLPPEELAEARKAADAFLEKAEQKAQ